MSMEFWSKWKLLEDVIENNSDLQNLKFVFDSGKCVFRARFEELGDDESWHLIICEANALIRLCAVVFESIGSERINEQIELQKRGESLFKLSPVT